MTGRAGDSGELVARLQAENAALQAQLAQAYQHQATAATEYARVLDETHALQAIAAELASTRDMRALLDGIVERTMTVVGADAVTVWLLDEETGNLHVAASRGLSTTFLRGRLPQPTRPTAETSPTFTQVRRDRRPLFERDAPAATRTAPPRSPMRWPKRASSAHSFSPYSRRGARSWAW